MGKINSDNITQFDFGQNWDEFSKHSLTIKAVEQAKQNFLKLLGDIDIKGKSFVDIGFGQGLSLLSAASLGATAFGLDINPKCREVLNRNKIFFKVGNLPEIPVIVGSILDNNTTSSLSRLYSSFDIVHSWGVLHHTGNMWKAIETSSILVKDKGLFIIAIYNKHWSSKLWLLVKKMYNAVPKFFQKIMVWVFYLVIMLAKFLVTFKNPFKKERGMNFYYDVVDWIGGYPYEYASKEEIKQFVEDKGFVLLKFNKSQAPTGCNEYVFRRK